MKNVATWGKWMALGAVVMLGAAGCANNNDAASDNAVSDSIESPVMDKQDDQAIAGSDNSGDNATAGNTAGNSASNAAGNSAGGATGGSTTR